MSAIRVIAMYYSLASLVVDELDVNVQKSISEALFYTMLSDLLNGKLTFWWIIKTDSMRFTSVGFLGIYNESSYLRGLEEVLNSSQPAFNIYWFIL